MGGLLKACGCFDGPWSEDDNTLVSVRCNDHADEPPLEGYVPMRRNQAGVAVMAHVARQRRMAIPRGRLRRR